MKSLTDFFRREAKGADSISLNTFLENLEAVYSTVSKIAVTPNSSMQSPTVQAIVQAISRRISVSPVSVLQKTMDDGKEIKIPQPNHPVARLFRQPNNFQDRMAYWLDSTSILVRWGNFYAFKNASTTGRVVELIPLNPSSVEVEQNDDFSLSYRYTQQNGGTRVFAADEILHARGPARNLYKGDSPVMDVREAIALEIAAERFGATFFGNGAVPFLVFKYMQGVGGMKTDEAEKKFKDEIDRTYSAKSRYRSLLLPKGLEMEDPIRIDNEEGQFLESRKLQRTVIAGAFNVPPHMVGDLEKGTFNNVEQQDTNFIINVVLPVVRMQEAAMERSLLTRREREDGYIIRFNLDAVIRADFKTRQEGLKIQREMGVINPNEWRERENMNPISAEDGGDTYWQQGPSGQGAEDGGQEIGGEDGE